MRPHTSQTGPANMHGQTTLAPVGCGSMESAWLIHGIGMVYVIAFSSLVSLFPNRVIVFSFFALCFSESIFNSLFHAGATAIFGVYCPGLITALVLYPPLLWYLSSTAYHEGLLTRALGFLAFAIAGVIHGIEVAVSVFGVGRNSFRRTRFLARNQDGSC